MKITKYDDTEAVYTRMYVLYVQENKTKHVPLKGVELYTCICQNYYHYAWENVFG